MSFTRALLGLLAWIGTMQLGFAAPSGATFGLRNLHELHRLPEYKDSTGVGSVSSYDRTGGNDDGFSGKHSFIRKDSQGLVLADLKGPGVIYRIWTPTPSDDTLEFLFDGETEPRVSVKFRELFLGKHPDFPAPLVGFGAGGYYCYVPIQYSNSCVVRIRAERVQFYQINYATYDERAGIMSFQPGQGGEYAAQMDKARELLNSAGADVSRYAAPPGASVRVQRGAFQVNAKHPATIFSQESRGGRIVGLKISPADALSDKSRRLMLKMTFDGQLSVLCPVGDFFGYAWGRPAAQSLLIGTAGTTNYCYYPMPFGRSAKVEVISDGGPPADIAAEVAFAPVAKAENEGMFRALWRRENPTTLGKPFTFLNARGKGHLVGVTLQCQGMEMGKTLYFEGDDQTTIDGKLVIHGTGSEDFFNGGWYDVPDRWEKRISFPLSGCLGYAKHLGRTGAYRLFLADAYPWKESILQTIEHSGERNEILTDHVGVTYVYTDAALPEQEMKTSAGQRVVNDPREIVFAASWQMPIYAWSFDRASLTRKKHKIGDEEVRCISLAADGGDWFGQHFISLTADLPEAGMHSVFIQAVAGPAQAKVQLFQNENPIGEPVDLYSETAQKSGRKLLGSLRLSEGGNNLMIKLVGKNEKSTALGFDLVEVICVRD